MLKTLLIFLALAPAQTPAFAPTEAHTGKSGSTVFLVAPATARLQAAPTLFVNGQAVALTPGPISGGFWSFSVAKPVNPGDSLQLSAPAGWVAGAPALDLPVRNCAGRPELPITERPAMGLGINISYPQVSPYFWWCAAANFAVRLGDWNGSGPQVASTDAQGNATRFVGLAKSVSAPVVINTAPNGIDRRGTPQFDPGTWTVVWDSDDSQTELALTQSGDWPVVPRAELASPGIKGIGITRVFDVQPPAAGGSLTPRLALSVSHPAGTPSYKNLGIFPPGNAIDRHPLALEAWTRRVLSVGDRKGPAAIRWMDSVWSIGCMSNVVEPADLLDIHKPWGGAHQGRQIIARVAQIRPLNLSASPAVETIYGPIAIASKAVFDAGKRWVCEVLTQAPHGFRSGQRVYLPLAGMRASVGGKTINLVNSNVNAWVTGPSAFIAVLYNTDNPGAIQDLDAPITPADLTAAVSLSTSGPTLPIEFAARATGEFDGCILWVNIPPYANDRCVDALAEKALAHLPRGHQVLVEYANETWNWGFDQAAYAAVMGHLLGLPSPIDSYTARRSAEAAARFAAVFARAGRASDILSCYASQFGNLQYHAGLGYARQQGIRFGAVSLAPYMAIPGDDVPTWTIAQLHDYARAYLAFDPYPTRMFADLNVAASAYERAMGRKTLRVGYEAGIDWVSRDPARTADFFSHPDMLVTEKTYYQLCERAGFDFICHYSLCVPLFWAPGANFGLYTWQGQLWGTGDGSDGRPPNPPIGSSGVWRPTVSVRGQAWRDWQRASLLSRPQADR